jgi:hypothetical protein
MKAGLQKKERVIIQEKRNWPGGNNNLGLPAEPNLTFIAGYGCRSLEKNQILKVAANTNVRYCSLFTFCTWSKQIFK